VCVCFFFAFAVFQQAIRWLHFSLTLSFSICFSATLARAALRRFGGLIHQNHFGRDIASKRDVNTEDTVLHTTRHGNVHRLFFEFLQCDLGKFLECRLDVDRLLGANLRVRKRRVRTDNCMYAFSMHNHQKGEGGITSSQSKGCCRALRTIFPRASSEPDN
jgi:hypothetical protein